MTTHVDSPGPTPAPISSSFLLPVVLLAAACGGEPVELPAHGSSEQNVRGRVEHEVTAEARAAVQAVCRGTYPDRGTCVECVEEAARAFAGTVAFAGVHVSDVVGEFAKHECRAGCIPPTCAAEGVSCGVVPDGCGGALDCGVCSSVPSLVRCFCVDGAQLEACVSDIDCGSGPAQDLVCGPLCASHGGELGTACFPEDPACAP